MSCSFSHACGFCEELRTPGRACSFSTDVICITRRRQDAQATSTAWRIDANNMNAPREADAFYCF